MIEVDGAATGSKALPSYGKKDVVEYPTGWAEALFELEYIVVLVSIVLGIKLVQFAVELKALLELRQECNPSREVVVFIA